MSESLVLWDMAQSLTMIQGILRNFDERLARIEEGMARIEDAAMRFNEYFSSEAEARLAYELLQIAKGGRRLPFPEDVRQKRLEAMRQRVIRAPMKKEGVEMESPDGST